MRKLPSLKYAKQYSEKGLWKFIKKFGKKAGRETISGVFKLWYTLSEGKASPSTKTLILAALGYTICPLDLIPDIIPMLGLSDDASVIAATLMSIANDITPEIAARADKKAKEILS